MQVEDKVLESGHSLLRQPQKKSKFKEIINKCPYSRSSAFKNIITNDFKLINLFTYAESIADSLAPILITGETGTGKELFTQAIHNCSNKSGSLISVNAAGIDDITFSDTLFGHRKGAFTGAFEDRQGLLSKAKNGTLFLDEIGDLCLQSQIKLLRLIDSGEYYPLGSDSKQKSNTHLITATHKNLNKLVNEGKFRDDLFYRLETHTLHIPPLRERIEDIPLLVNYFLSNKTNNFNISKVTKIVNRYSFPGNIRELKSILLDTQKRSICDQTFLLCLDQIISRKRETLYSTSFDKEQSLSSFHSLPTLKKLTQMLIDEALIQTEGNKAKAAAIMGISKQALCQRLSR